MNARTHVPRRGCLLKIAGPERPVPCCPPAAADGLCVCVRLFQGVRERERNLFDGGERPFEPCASAPHASAVASNTYRCHSRTDVSSELCSACTQILAAVMAERRLVMWKHVDSGLNLTDDSFTTYKHRMCCLVGLDVSTEHIFYCSPHVLEVAATL